MTTRKTNDNVVGMIRRLEGNTGLILKWNKPNGSNSLCSVDEDGHESDSLIYEVSRSNFYYAIYSANKVIEQMEIEKNKKTKIYCSNCAEAFDSDDPRIEMITDDSGTYPVCGSCIELTNQEVVA